MIYATDMDYDSICWVMKSKIELEKAKIHESEKRETVQAAAKFSNASNDKPNGYHAENIVPFCFHCLKMVNTIGQRQKRFR